MSDTKTAAGKAKFSLGAVLIALLAWGAQRLGWIDLPAGETQTAPAPTEQAETKAPSEPPVLKAPPAPAETPSTETPSEEADDEGLRAIIAADRAQRSGFMVEVTAPVERTLTDDNEGSRHQRFILRLTDDLTVLVAHNIDLAPRVPLSEGDTVTVFGQYEANERGGVLHWTHHDPGKRHEEGWIRHEGKVYE